MCIRDRDKEFEVGDMVEVVQKYESVVNKKYNFTHRVVGILCKIDKNREYPQIVLTLRSYTYPKKVKVNYTDIKDCNKVKWLVISEITSINKLVYEQN